MIKHLWSTLSTAQAFALLALGCAGLLGFGMYLQHVVGLEPCPMCIVQRYAMTLIGILALLGWVWRSMLGHRVLAVLSVLLALGGAFVAARQTWLQWYPPEVASCGRDFYGMIESFPLQRAIPLIFRGSGDCSAVDWSFLGGSIANWSLVAFVGMALWMLLVLFTKLRSASIANDEQF